MSFLAPIAPFVPLVTNLFGKKSQGQPASQTTTSAPPVIPDWLLPYMQNAASQANQIGQMPYQAYPGQQIAGLTPDQLRSMQLAEQMPGQAQQGLNQANNLLQQVGQYGTQGPTQGQLNAYMNPYQKQVMDASRLRQLQQYTQSANQLRERQGATGAFGGSGAAIQQSELEKNFQQQLAENESNQLFSGWNTAQGLIQKGMGLAGDAGINLSTNAIRGEQASLADIGALQGAGGMLQNQNQAQLSNAMQMWQEQRDYPYTQATKALSLLDPMARIATGNQGTSTVTQNAAKPSWAQTLLSTGMFGGTGGTGGSSSYNPFSGSGFLGNVGSGVESFFGGTGFGTGYDVNQSINNPANSSFFAGGGLVPGYAHGGHVATPNLDRKYHNKQGVPYSHSNMSNMGGGSSSGGAMARGGLVGAIDRFHDQLVQHYESGGGIAGYDDGGYIGSDITGSDNSSLAQYDSMYGASQAPSFYNQPIFNSVEEARAALTDPMISPSVKEAATMYMGQHVQQARSMQNAMIRAKLGLPATTLAQGYAQGGVINPEAHVAGIRRGRKRWGKASVPLNPESAGYLRPATFDDGGLVDYYGGGLVQGYPDGGFVDTLNSGGYQDYNAPSDMYSALGINHPQALPADLQRYNRMIAEDPTTPGSNLLQRSATFFGNLPAYAHQAFTGVEGALSHALVDPMVTSVAEADQIIANPANYDQKTVAAAYQYKTTQMQADRPAQNAIAARAAQLPTAKPAADAVKELLTHVSGGENIPTLGEEAKSAQATQVAAPAPAQNDMLGDLLKDLTKKRKGMPEVNVPLAAFGAAVLNSGPNYFQAWAAGRKAYAEAVTGEQEKNLSDIVALANAQSEQMRIKAATKQAQDQGLIEARKAHLEEQTKALEITSKLAELRQTMNPLDKVKASYIEKALVASGTAGELGQTPEQILDYADRAFPGTSSVSPAKTGTKYTDGQQARLKDGSIVTFDASTGKWK